MVSSRRGKKGEEGWTAAEEGDKSERWHTLKRMEMGQAEVERQERRRKRSRVLFQMEIASLADGCSQ